MQKKNWYYPAFLSVFLGAFFPIIASETTKNIPPFFALSSTIFLATIICILLVFPYGKYQDFRNKEAWKYGILTGLINGAAYYSLFYIGLKYTSPGNAVLVAQTELMFSYVFFQMWKKESLHKTHLYGVILIAIGTIYLLLPKATGWNFGDFLILIASMLAPVGNHFQKTGRMHVSSITFLVMRYISTLPIVIVGSIVLREQISFVDIGRSFWLILVMALGVFVIKMICWIESIKLVTVTRVLALHGLIPFFTLLFAWILLGTPPNSTQLIAGIPMFVGVLLLTKK